MSYPLELLRPQGPTERPPPRTFNNNVPYGAQNPYGAQSQYQGTGNTQNKGQNVTINLGQSGTQESPFIPGGNMMSRARMRDRMSQQHVNDSINVNTGNKTHWIVLLVIVIIIIGSIGALLYFTGACNFSQNMYTDANQCCQTCNACSKQFEGTASCLDCNGMKACNQMGC